MSASFTALEQNDDLEDRVAPALDVSSALSPLTQSSSVYRGSKGSFYRKHDNPRQLQDNDPKYEFMTEFCNGCEDNFESVKAKFAISDSNQKTKEQATGMIENIL